MSREELRAWVAETRAAQDLGPTITDPATLATLARMVTDTMMLARQGGDHRGP